MFESIFEFLFRMKYKENFKLYDAEGKRYSAFRPDGRKSSDETPPFNQFFEEQTPTRQSLKEYLAVYQARNAIHGTLATLAIIAKPLSLILDGGKGITISLSDAHNKYLTWPEVKKKCKKTDSIVTLNVNAARIILGSLILVKVIETLIEEFAGLAGDTVKSEIALDDKVTNYFFLYTYLILILASSLLELLDLTVGTGKVIIDTMKKKLEDFRSPNYTLKHQAEHEYSNWMINGCTKNMYDGDRHHYVALLYLSILFGALGFQGRVLVSDAFFNFAIIVKNEFAHKFLTSPNIRNATIVNAVSTNSNAITADNTPPTNAGNTSNTSIDNVVIDDNDTHNEHSTRGTVVSSNQHLISKNNAVYYQRLKSASTQHSTLSDQSENNDTLLHSTEEMHENENDELYHETINQHFNHDEENGETIQLINNPTRSISHYYDNGNLVLSLFGGNSNNKPSCPTKDNNNLESNNNHNTSNNL